MIYALCGIIVVIEIVHYLERRDLYNRIMCSSITEYKNPLPKPKSVKSRHEELLEKWRKGGGTE